MLIVFAEYESENIVYASKMEKKQQKTNIKIMQLFVLLISIPIERNMAKLNSTNKEVLDIFQILELTHLLFSTHKLSIKLKIGNWG